MQLTTLTMVVGAARVEREDWLIKLICMLKPLFNCFTLWRRAWKQVPKFHFSIEIVHDSNTVMPVKTGKCHVLNTTTNQGIGNPSHILWYLIGRTPRQPRDVLNV